MKKPFLIFVCGMALFSCSQLSFASSGTEGASFLDIPVGARPAALGSSYSALATDAYAPVWNPAGLGFLNSTQLAGMHLSYLDTINNEFASFVHPFSPGHALGISGQYFSPGDSKGTDITGTPTGDFSGHYASYSLAYGQRLGESVALGVTGKVIDAKIADVSAHAYGFDAGAMVQATRQLRLAAVVANVGTKLNFLNEGDSLPGAFRLGALYTPMEYLNLTAEGVYGFNGLASAHTGIEVTPSQVVSIRAGFRSDTVKNLSGFSGFTTGIGLHLWGQEFDYAWVPLGDLGDTQYFSLVIRLGAPAENQKNLQTHQNAQNKEEPTFTPEAILGAAL
jgi:hypothetical protein